MSREEEFKYEIERNRGSRDYDVRIYRNNCGKWSECKRLSTYLTMWGAKRAANRWIKNWANGKFRQASYMNIVKVDRKWD